MHSHTQANGPIQAIPIYEQIDRQIPVQNGDKHTPRSNRNPIKPDDIPNLLREEKPRAQQHLAWKSSSDATLRKARRYVSDRRWTDDAVKGQRLWLPGVNLAHANHVGVHATSAAVSSIC